MFDDNWILFLFILMLLFGRDGEISGTSLSVLLASTLAILFGENGGLFGRCNDANATT